MVANKGQHQDKKLKVILSSIGIFICLAAGAAAGLGLYISNGLSPMESSDKEVHVVIPQGLDSQSISSLLEEKGVIRNHALFTFYLKYKNEGAKFQAGEYVMKPGISLDQVIDKLNSGETVKEATIRFTMPEGYTLTQIADKLAEHKFVDRQSFINAAQGLNGLKAGAIAHIPDNQLLKFKLEGYLFPETYEMKKGSSETEIMNRMLQELDKKLEQLPSGWQENLKERGIGFHEMMTIASLIEREVVVDEERPIVAGVIYNRLNKEMHLQIDATVQYIFDKQKGRLFYEDLQVDSPYNTYLHLGLPPGPIASPSLKSIEAALYPEQTKYLFYVTKKDGTQGHLFAETFDGHRKNIKESSKK